jgi:Helix-turn-helix domain
MKKPYRAVPLDRAIARLPAARRERIKARADDIVAEEMALRDLRKLRRVTQEEVARRLGGRQVYVSRLERRADMKLSTLRDFVEAVGGELQLVVTFPEGTEVKLKDFGEATRGKSAAAKR